MLGVTPSVVSAAVGVEPHPAGATGVSGEVREDHTTDRLAATSRRPVTPTQGLHVSPDRRDHLATPVSSDHLLHRVRH